MQRFDYHRNLQASEYRLRIPLLQLGSVSGMDILMALPLGWVYHPSELSFFVSSRLSDRATELLTAML